MGKEIVISAEKEQTQIAILENGELVELYIEGPENERTIGDIVLGRVRKIMPSIQAAFIDIGQKQDAFLHFSDLSDNLPDLLAFVASETPEVGKQLPSSDRARSHAQRRRSAHNHPRHAAEDGDVTEEEDEEEQEHKPLARADSKERGHRREAQRRSTRKAQDEGTPAKAQATAEVPEDLPPPHTFLKRDQRILVKIVKEPISAKGSRVSTDISLAGRFLVLVPMAGYIAVSKKIISYKERRRLRALAKSLAPEGFGVIVRTVAEGKSAKALDTDLRLLVEKWRRIEARLAGHPEPPLVVHEDVNMVSSVVRDLFSDDYDRILVDDYRLFRNIKNYVQAVAPHMAPAVQNHKGGQHIFETTKIANDIAQVFEPRADLPSGGYLFIERTEAMFVIDVNSGRSGRGMTQEANSLKVNLEAARVIARQTRLRDIGGIIVVDFIDLRDEKNRQKVYEELKKEFRKDRAVVKLLPMSDFGLVQITRQRLRPSITTTFSGPNGKPPVPKEAERPKSQERPREQRQNPQNERDGSPDRPAEAKPAPYPNPDALVERMDQWISDYKTQGKRGPLVLRVHPFTSAYLNRKVPTYPTRWFVKHLIRVRLEPDEQLDPMGFRFLDARNGEDLTERMDLHKPEHKGHQSAEA